MIVKQLVELTTVGRYTERIGYYEVDSGKPGPVLAVMAAQHGNELNGCVSIHDFIKLAGQQLIAGKVIGIPFANPVAVRSRMPNADLLPGQPYIESNSNMAALWSSPQGCDTARMADALWNKLLCQADYIIDIHSYPKFMTPVAAVRDDDAGRKLAQASGMKFVRYIPAAADWQGSIRVRALKHGKQPLGIELGGQYELYPESVQMGLKVLLNVAKYTGMMEGKPETIDGEQVSMGPQTTVYSPGVGLFVPEKSLKPGAWFEKGQQLGYLLEEISLKEIPVCAPVCGYIMRMPSRPNADVTLRDHSQFMFLDDPVASIMPPEK